jgi:hypothetical protein
MVRGVERREDAMIAKDDSRLAEATVHSYWWVCYPQRQNPVTQPHFTARDRLVIFDNEAFRQTTWYRSNDSVLSKHWAYAANAFISTADRTQIEWTPGVPNLRVRSVSPAELDVEIRSATPNFQAYVVRLNGSEPRASAEGRLRWKLEPGTNTLQVRARNLFGVEGPLVTATVAFQP